MSAFSKKILLDCYVQTDKMCIAINIANLQLYFIGHNKSLEECRWLLAMTVLSAGDGTALCGFDEFIKLDDDKERSSCTWLNWSNDGDDTIKLMGASKLREPSGITTVDKYQITLDLLRLISCNVMEPLIISRRCAEAIVAYLSVWIRKETFLAAIQLRLD